MRFIVEGTDLSTGKRARFAVNADTPEAAQAKVVKARGIHVTSVKPDSPPSSSPATAPSRPQASAAAVATAPAAPTAFQPQVTTVPAAAPQPAAPQAAPAAKPAKAGNRVLKVLLILGGVLAFLTVLCVVTGVAVYFLWPSAGARGMGYRKYVAAALMESPNGSCTYLNVQKALSSEIGPDLSKSRVFDLALGAIEAEPADVRDVLMVSGGTDSYTIVRLQKDKSLADLGRGEPLFTHGGYLCIRTGRSGYAARLHSRTYLLAGRKESLEKFLDTLSSGSGKVPARLAKVLDHVDTADQFHASCSSGMGSAGTAASSGLTFTSPAKATGLMIYPSEAEARATESSMKSIENQSYMPLSNTRITRDGNTLTFSADVNFGKLRSRMSTLLGR